MSLSTNQPTQWLQTQRFIYDGLRKDNMMEDTQIDDDDEIPYDEKRSGERVEHLTHGKIQSPGGVKRWPNSPWPSISTSPAPPLLSRTQAGVVASRPGAIRVAGLQQPSDLHNDDDSTMSPTSQRRSAQPRREEEEDVLVSAELVVPSGQEEPLSDVTADVAHAPAQASEAVSSHPELVHAEPFCEPQIGWKEILKNKTIGLCLLVSFAVMAVITIIVVFAVMGVKSRNDHGPAAVSPGVPPGVSPGVSPGIPPSPFRSPKGSGSGKH